jgi:hypothetical protein
MHYNTAAGRENKEKGPSLPMIGRHRKNDCQLRMQQTGSGKAPRKTKKLTKNICSVE